MNLRFLSLFLAVLVVGFSQQLGTVRGTVTDETGAVIPATNVRLEGQGGRAVEAQTNESGLYAFTGVRPGKYTVRVNVPGFANYEALVDVAPGAVATVDPALSVTLEVQRIEVESEAVAQVTTDPTRNVGAIVLRGEDLQTLSDDPDELASDLQALAGPSAGPNGGQIFIDGFSGARLPPKESIREVRINQNPFSAEFDRLGFGRIEIFTKPGSDRYHGQALFGFSDRLFNSRNPFAVNQPEYQSRVFGANFGGPINKRTSFFFAADRRAVEDNSIVNATVLDPNLNITRLEEAVLTPQSVTSFSPRIDYAINANNTLVARYNFQQRSRLNSNVGEFTLLSRGIENDMSDHQIQITETAVLSAKAINETRLQYIRQRTSQVGDNTEPALNVLEAFSGGGAQVGNVWANDHRWEAHNTTSIAQGSHSIKFGGRVRRTAFDESSPRNFGGTFTFGGLNTGAGTVTSIERYRITLLGLRQGLPMDQIRALGGGASQFTIAGGNPLAGVTQWDAGIFLQDDWRLRPNLTVSLGLRYEAQTNVRDWSNVAPRIGIAWAPGGGSGRPGKTVLRGGFGMFYDRVDSDLTLNSVRFNGVNQQQLIIDNPDFFSVIPPFDQLTGRSSAQTTYQLAPDMRAPYMIQSALTVERQLPWSSTLSATFTNTRALHLLRSVSAGALRPDIEGNLYRYESTGRMTQNQMMVNFSNRMSRQFTVFSYYALNRARSDTDGVNTFPADPFDYTQEWGRASNDIRHRFVMGGNLVAPYGLRFNPFVIASSGRPFNITVGRDLNRDTVFADRPAFAQPGQPGAIETRFGWFNPLPGAGDTIIPRNYANGPRMFTVNLRASRSFSFGGVRQDNRPAGMGGGGGMRGGGGGSRGGRGGFGGGGPRGPRGGGPMDAGSSTGAEQRFNLTVSAQARNLLNTTNLATPVGNLSSALFGVSTQTAGGFGGSDANNRRLEFQLRLTF